MAYVYPTGTLKILHNINLNNDYDHTIYFANKGAQTAYFMGSGKVKYTLNNQSYQRKERGWLQVNKHQMDLLDCTYIMFQTTSSSRWFYAFITSIEYVNEGVSRIRFEIDVIQTWMFDENTNNAKWTLDKCFVEREHTTSDDLFEHTLPEDLDLGNEYHVQAIQRKNLDCSYLAVVLSTELYQDGQGNPAFTAFNPRRLGSYFTGVGYWCYDLADPNEQGTLVSWLKDYINAGGQDGIISMYQYPRFMGLLSRNSSTFDNAEGYATDTFSFTSLNYTQINGYTPKNNKLFCYPYNFVEMNDGLGHSAIIKHELWKATDRGEFVIRGTQMGVPTCICFPYNYDGVTIALEHGLTMKFDLTNPFVGDAYQVWLAKNQKNIDLEKKIGIEAMVGGAALAVVGGVVAGETGNTRLANAGLGTFAYGARSLVNSVLEKTKAKNTLEATPKPFLGQFANDALNLQSNNCAYTFMQKTVRAEYAKIIDEFFSRFGYACNRVKVPNIHARDNWTYTKTIGCEINGNIPSDDANKIKAIFDHGVTFWSNGDNIGNYGDFTNGIYAPTPTV